MRNLLALAALVVLGFSGTGLWRGWYSIETLPAEAGRSAFRVEINRWKVAEDVGAAASRIARALKSDQADAASAHAESHP